ncbi:MAG TPA: ABC transporter permease [Thermomicrobiales bacterium]|nr:ABC transporter permease [Thermomicrobiales bacterium]
MTARSSGAIINIVGSILAIVVALLIGAIVIIASGHNPWEAYQALFEGALGTRRGRAETLVYSAPLLLGGLAFAVAARAGMFNIGIEGQLIVGGFAAALIGATDIGVPGPIHMAIAIVAAFLAGGIWGFIPGILRATTGAHEVITTIMFNYLAIRMITYLIQKRSDWLPVDPQIQGTHKVLPDARLPILLDATRLHAGVVIAAGAAIVIWILLFKTTFGFKLRTVGLSEGASRYGGIRWGMTLALAMGIAGGLAGLAGAGESLGLHGRHSSSPPGLGFTAIAVGLVGRNHPIGVIFSAVLFGMLSAGSPSMQASSGVSKEIVLVLQGLVILAVAAFEAINRMPFIRKLVTPARPGQGDRASEIGMSPEIEPRPSPPVL